MMTEAVKAFVRNSYVHVFSMKIDSFSLRIMFSMTITPSTIKKPEQGFNLQSYSSRKYSADKNCLA